MRRTGTIALACLALAGCDTGNRGAGAPPGDLLTNVAAPDAREDAADAPGAAAPDRDGWIGEWKGVEGLMLRIDKGAAAGSYRLTMQYKLDDKGVFDGSATPDGIAFRRPDGAQTLRAGDGVATGLKWLAGKKDCLVVKEGEGYCRD